MSALAPVDAASCRAMAVECGRRATYLAKRRFGAEALRELDRARELCILALKFEQESIPPSDGDAISEVKGIARPENAAGVEPPPSGPHSLPSPSPAADTPEATLLPASGEPIIVMTHRDIRS